MKKLLLVLLFLLSSCAGTVLQYHVLGREPFREEKIDGAQVRIFRYPDKKQVILIAAPNGSGYYFNGDSLIRLGPPRNSKLFTYRR